MESAITRQLQHAILQLCNEHVTYEHTLQVLGVVCVTVDDQPRDVVVKLNNTLKRVDAVTPVTDDRRGGAVRASVPTLWPRSGVATDACSSSTATAAASSTAAGPGVEPVPVRQGVSACGESTSRKCHGRKQSNPIKVKTVVDDDDDDDVDDDDEDGENCGGGEVLLTAPAETSAADYEPGSGSSLTELPYRLRSASGQLDAGELPQSGRHRAKSPPKPAARLGAVRTLLPAVAMDRTDGHSAEAMISRNSTTRSMFVDSIPESNPDDKLNEEGAITDGQEAALNFSLRTPDSPADGDRSPDCGTFEVKIKEELQAPFGMDLGSGRCGAFDMTRSVAAAAAAAAAFNQYVDDPSVLQTLTPYDQQRLALYTSFVTAAAASGVPDNRSSSASMSLLNGAALDGVDLSASKLDHSVGGTSFAAMTGRLGDGLRMQEMRRRERFSRGLHHSSHPPMKVC